ncbi:MAG: phosphopantetheine-binding protein, partial [Anaerolineaceae bacterium]|nr:phosphopantetheine-binding protein [Anaerolineaceae bacterium]
ITLNGGLYVTPQTREGFETALNDGFRVQLTADQSVAVTAAQEVPSIQTENEPLVETIQPEVLEKIDRQLVDFQAHQGDTLRVHEQYLKNEAEFGQILSDLAHMQVDLAANGAGTAEPDHPKRQVVQSLINSLESIHNHQDSTARVHEKYLNGQEAFSHTFSELVQRQLRTLPYSTVPVKTRPNGNGNNGNGHHPAAKPMPVAATPIPEEKPASVAAAPAAQPAPAAVNTDGTQPALLEVVSEKTGYPVEMLEMDMDMESDLGIDSIKRVEILGAMQERFPGLPEVEPSVLSELHTLQQVIDHLNASAPAPAALAVAVAAPVSTPAPVAAAEVASPPPAVEAAEIKGDVGDANQISVVLLTVVSEKTGYPEEMLEMDMDMESDLGIDSIKRVEILGAMQEHFPGLPEVDPAALSELHTLQQIIQHLNKGAVPEKKG